MGQKQPDGRQKTWYQLATMDPVRLASNEAKRFNQAKRRQLQELRRKFKSVWEQAAKNPEYLRASALYQIYHAIYQIYRELNDWGEVYTWGPLAFHVTREQLLNDLVSAIKVKALVEEPLFASAGIDTNLMKESANMVQETIDSLIEKGVLAIKPIYTLSISPDFDKTVEGARMLAVFKKEQLQTTALQPTFPSAKVVRGIEDNLAAGVVLSALWGETAAKAYLAELRGLLAVDGTVKSLNIREIMARQQVP
jgi:hypothetical protein